MKKRQNNQYVMWEIYAAIFILIPVGLYALQMMRGNYSSERVDFLCQHSVFPEYFRQLFYEYGTLFPQFSKELGAGQNIYYFAYYGLFNPVYWLGYLLPFVKMSTYVQAATVIAWIADGILCFLWLKRHFPTRDSFFASLVLVLSLPLVCHSLAQIMFVNYMPFLIITLSGYDRYKKTGKTFQMMAGVLLMILSSFYFAIGGLVAFGIYVVSDFKGNEINSPVKLFRKLWQSFYPAGLAVLLSLFYLVPVFFAMISGNRGDNSQSVIELLIPGFELDEMVYHAYGLGLTALFVIILAVSLLYGWCREKWLAIFTTVIMIIPIFSWLLNGGLYVRSKVFIPFVVLFCYLSAGFSSRIMDEKISRQKIMAGYVIAGMYLGLCAYHGIKSQKQALAGDLILCAVGLGIVMYKQKKAVYGLITVSMAAVALWCCINYTSSEQGIKDRTLQEELNNTLNSELLESVATMDERMLYRMELRGSGEYNKANINRPLFCNMNLTTSYSSMGNKYYKAFRNEYGLNMPTRNSLMQNYTSNPLFLNLMGVKYLAQDGVLQENTDEIPMFYVTNKLASSSEYHEADWIGKELLLSKAVVVSDMVEGNRVDYAGQLQGKSLDVEFPFREIKRKEAVEDKLILSDEIEADGYLFISFTLDNHKPGQDVSVTIGGQKNKLTSIYTYYQNRNHVFRYCLPVEKGTSQIPVTYGKGDYELTDMACSFSAYDKEAKNQLVMSAAKMVDSGKDNVYEGKINPEQAGVFVTSIPYEEDFTLYIDGKERDFYMVNTAFIGADMEAGEHTFKLVYHAPGRKLGIIASLITLLIVIADYYRRVKHGKHGLS